MALRPFWEAEKEKKALKTDKAGQITKNADCQNVSSLKRLINQIRTLFI